MNDTIDSLLAEYEHLRGLYNASFTANDIKTANNINAEMMEVAFGVCTLLLKARKEQPDELQRLRKAVTFIAPSCDCLHHPDGYFHSATDPCPVEKELEELLP